ncbi:putative F-box domain-containing protein [Tanacetum coccineum]
MSDKVPFDIQVKIIKKLPVKSLIQFRLVSKTWKSLIDSKEFIASYHIQEQQQQQHCLLVRYTDPKDSNVGEKHVSVIDDNTFPQHKITLERRLLSNLRFKSRDDFWFLADRYRPGENQRDPIVEVYTLSAGVWRSLSVNLPRKSLVFTHDQVAIGRFIYWRAYERRHVDAGLEWYNLIMSFDMTTDEFTEVYLPDNLALDPKSNFCIYKLRESLVVVQSKREADKLVYHVWKMIEQGAQKAFIELFTINTPDASIEYVHGFRTSGEPIVEVRIDLAEDALFVYEPNTKKLTYTGITAEQDGGHYFYLITKIV